MSLLVIINAILVVSQVVKLSNIIVAFGFSIENLFLPILYTIIPFLSFTIPIAFFFASLLHYSRLNQDGEFTALQAAGFSLFRAAKPVIVVSALLYVIASMCAIHLEAWGRRELLNFVYRNAQTQLDNIIKVQLKPGVFFDNFLGFVLYAEEISQDRTKLTKVLIAPQRSSDDTQKNFTIFAPVGFISGSVETGDLKLNLKNGRSFSYDEQNQDTRVVEFNEADINLLRVFPKRLFGEEQKKDDYRSFDAAELSDFVDIVKHDESQTQLYHKAAYLYHQRIGVPFVVFIFGLFGLVLGIQDLRSGKNKAFAWAIAIIIANYVLSMGFKWLGEQTYLTPILAVWVPNLLLSALVLYIAYQKNRLPPSEPVFTMPSFLLKASSAKTKNA